MTQEFICSSKNQLYQEVSDKCATLLNNDIERYGQASINVPGGTTPAPVFELLSKMTLPWNKISIVPSDERWIDINHDQSNQFLIERTLLINNASSANFVGLKNDADSPFDGEAETAERLAKLLKPASVTVLGMGADGHVASLFPDTPQIETALDLSQNKLCIGIDAKGCAVAGDYTQRMSQTLVSLVDATVVILLITGSEKLEVVRRAKQRTDFNSQPVAALLAQTKTPVEIYWAE